MKRKLLMEESDEKGSNKFDKVVNTLEETSDGIRDGFIQSIKFTFAVIVLLIIWFKYIR